MSKRLPATRLLAPQQPVVVPWYRYVEEQQQGREVILRTAAEVAAYREHQERLQARSRARLEKIAEHDRKVRRFWLGFGAVFALAVLAVLAVLLWLAWNAVGVLAVPLLLFGTAALVAGGQRCVTIVQHWH